jgi:hypothetical protein
MAPASTLPRWRPVSVRGRRCARGGIGCGGIATAPAQREDGHESTQRELRQGPPRDRRSIQSSSPLCSPAASGDHPTTPRRHEGDRAGGGTGVPPCRRLRARTMYGVNTRDEIREFLASRRARIIPERRARKRRPDSVARAYLLLSRSAGQLLVNFSQSKQRLCDCSEEGKAPVTRLFACRAGRIRTADLLTPRQSQGFSK